MEKYQLIRKIDFGQRIAEDETDSLYKYFSETVQWEQIEDDEIDIVFGSKGSGKSALFARLIGPNYIKSKKRVLVIPGENLTGAPIFETINEEELIGGRSVEELRLMRGHDFDQLEKRLVKIWKIYFLMLIANELKRLELTDRELELTFNDLERLGVLEESANLKDVFENVVKYVNRVNVTIGVKLGPVELGVEKQKSGEEKKKDSLDSFDTSTVFKSIDSYLQRIDRPIWIALDRLDAAFAQSGILRMSFLRSLLRVYLDLKVYSQIKLKLFLRDDIWDEIISESSNRGFVELSHIAKYSRIHWRKESLLNLIVRRVLENQNIINFFSLEKEKVLKNFKDQSDLFDSMFPQELCETERGSAFNWIYNELEDGNGQVFPRDIIHFFQELKREQRELFNIGDTNFKRELQLFSISAVEKSLSSVSEAKLNQTVFAEYPEDKGNIRALTEKSNFLSIEDLSKVWFDEFFMKKEKSADIVRGIASKLCKIGILRESDDKSNYDYSVGNIYKRVLRIEG